MLHEEEWSVMREKKRQGISVSQVARENGVSWRTARKYMECSKPPEYTSRASVPSILDPYKDYIKERLERWPLTATKLFEEIGAMGYTGKYTLVKEFVRPMKRDRAIAAELRYETEPGIQSQVDWFDFGPIEVDGLHKKLWCFSMILGFSRTRFMAFTTDATTPTFIQCHLDAFNYFGGYTETILYDNTKNVVLKRMLKSSDSVWNPLFKDFFTYYGFTPRLCKPGLHGAKTKGKIERTGQYIRGNFFMGLDYSSIQDLNAKALAWCCKVNAKVHDTTNEIPFDRLKQEALTRTNDKPPYQIVLTEHRRVSNDCFLSFRGNKYSVPWRCAGREAKLLIKDTKMGVEIGGETVCAHEIVAGSHRRIRIKEHFTGLYKAILHRNRDAHIRRIEGHAGDGPAVVMSLSGSMPSSVQVQKRDLTVYDSFASQEGTK